MKITNSRGRAVTIDLPASIAPIALSMRNDLEKKARLEAQLVATRDERLKLKNELEVAEFRKGEEIAAAVLDERPMPKTDPTRKIRDQLDLADSRIVGLETAIERQTEIALGTLERDREEFVAIAVAQRQAAEAAYAEAIETLVATRRTFLANARGRGVASRLPAQQGQLVGQLWLDRARQGDRP